MTLLTTLWVLFVTLLVVGGYCKVAFYLIDEGKTLAGFLAAVSGGIVLFAAISGLMGGV